MMTPVFRFTSIRVATVAATLFCSLQVAAPVPTSAQDEPSTAPTPAASPSTPAFQDASPTSSPASTSTAPPVVQDVSHSVVNQDDSPIVITSIKFNKGQRAFDYDDYRLNFHAHQPYIPPALTWSFVNHSTETAKDIRFVVMEKTGFNEVVQAHYIDLTGTFSPNVQIQDRADVTGGKISSGTHWEVVVTKILWDDGSVWSTAAPAPTTAPGF